MVVYWKRVIWACSTIIKKLFASLHYKTNHLDSFNFQDDPNYLFERFWLTWHHVSHLYGVTSIIREVNWTFCNSLGRSIKLYPKNTFLYKVTYFEWSADLNSRFWFNLRKYIENMFQLIKIWTRFHIFPKIRFLYFSGYVP